MSRVLFCLAALASAASCGSSYGWNRGGHMTISLVAYQQMSDEAKQWATELLKKHERFEEHFTGRMPDTVRGGTQSEKDRWAFAHASTWPDQIRSTSARGVTRDDVIEFNRPMWHYINLPHYLNNRERDELDGELLVNLGREVPSGERARRKMNVIQAYKLARIVLGSENARDFKKAKYLCWLLHLGEDAHQPLHSTALFTTQRFDRGDKGGNSIDIGNKSMHSTWDRFIAGNRNYNSVQSLAFQLTEEEASHELGESAAEELSIDDWIEESHELAKEYAYTRPILEFVRSRETQGGGELGSIDPGYSYYEQGGAVAKKRAVEAGYRLAAVLEDLASAD